MIYPRFRTALISSVTTPATTGRATLVPDSERHPPLIEKVMIIVTVLGKVLSYISNHNLLRNYI